MLGTKNPMLVDRKVFDRRGSWKNPQQDIAETIFYFISQNKTITKEWNGSREELVETMEITMFGEKPIIVGDMITLETKEKMRVRAIEFVYFESNIAIKDFLKPMVKSMILTLE